MAGSHEVRGSIPLGSTTDSRGARRRRRAPLFYSRGRRPGARGRAGEAGLWGRKRVRFWAPARAGAHFFMGKAAGIGFPARTRSASGHWRFPRPHGEIHGKRPPIPGGCRG